MQKHNTNSDIQRQNFKYHRPATRADSFCDELNIGIIYIHREDIKYHDNCNGLMFVPVSAKKNCQHRDMWFTCAYSTTGPKINQ